MNNLRLTILIALAAFFLTLPAAGPGAVAWADEAGWSKQAYAIPRDRPFRVPSPDRKKTIIIADLSLVVIDSGSPVPGIEGYTLLLPAEISWAPDSKAFFITSNEGGIGEEAWFVTAYVLEYDRISYYDVTVEAAGRFKELIKCPDAGDPHFGAIKWLKESKNLLVVAEAPARGSCSEAGRIQGYIVEVPSGKVLSELEPKKLSERWREYLGARVARRLLR